MKTRERGKNDEEMDDECDGGDGPGGAPMTSMPVLANDAQVEPQADVIRWVTKWENGILYKRKYNFSKERWEGPWIRVE